MRRVEDIIGDTIAAGVGVLIKQLIKPDMKFKSVADIDKKMIESLKRDYGIEAIVLDVDETLRSDSKDIPKCNKEWLQNLKGELKVIILSNGIDRDVEKYFNEIGIDYIGFALKPLKRNFKKACEKLQVRPEKTLMIGNDLIDDVWGGRRSKMKTALVREVDDDER